MVDTGIVQKLLELLDRHVDEGNVTVQHAALSALRNLAIPGLFNISQIKLFLVMKNLIECNESSCSLQWSTSLRCSRPVCQMLSWSFSSLKCLQFSSSCWERYGCSSTHRVCIHSPRFRKQIPCMSNVVCCKIRCLNRILLPLKTFITLSLYVLLLLTAGLYTDNKWATDFFCAF